MLDIKYIREHPEEVAQNAKNKGYTVDVNQILELDARRRELVASTEEIRARRNELSKGGAPSSEDIALGKKLREELAGIDDDLGQVKTSLGLLLREVPNMALSTVPVGSSENDNQIVKTVGEKPDLGFVPQSDAELGSARGFIDKDRAAKVAGARFAYLKGNLVKLQFAIIQMTLDILGDEKLIARLITENNLSLKPTAFVPVIPPALVRTEPYQASGRLDAQEVTYKLADDELWLNASAEHSLCTMYMNETLSEDQLPVRMVGYSTSFRREAGSYGKDTEGIFRMHQFDKLEMEVFSTADTGLEEHKLLVAIQEYLVEQLELPYQLLQKCTADIGKPNAQGMDINTWMPAQAEYRETHTADYMTDFQARSLATKVRLQDGQVEFAHTNDATAFALGRIMKAILENHQQADGGVRVPKALRQYYGGETL
jgi:seryl-tRNA synthetase